MIASITVLNELCPLLLADVNADPLHERMKGGVGLFVHS